MRTQAAYDGNLDVSAGGNRLRLDPRLLAPRLRSIPDCDTDRWFNLSALKCRAALQAFITAGSYNDRMGQYDPTNSSSGKRWEAFATSGSARRTNVVECEDDAGAPRQRRATRRTSMRATAARARTATGARLRSESPGACRRSILRACTLYSGNYMNWTYGPTVRSDAARGRQRGRERPARHRQRRQRRPDDVQRVPRLHRRQPGRLRRARDGGHRRRARATCRPTIDALDARGVDAAVGDAVRGRACTIKGGAVDYRQSRQRQRLARTRHPSQYDSPIDIACQKNFIVLLTDGEPTWDDRCRHQDSRTDRRERRQLQQPRRRQLRRRNLSGGLRPVGRRTASTISRSSSTTATSRRETEQQNITTYTVGFTVDLPILADTAQRGGGEYFTADDTATLSGSLQQIVTSILATNTTFTAPTVAVNAFNRTQNLSDLFISVFRPSLARALAGQPEEVPARRDDGADRRRERRSGDRSGHGLLCCRRAGPLVGDRGRRGRRRRRCGQHHPDAAASSTRTSARTTP